MTDAMYLAIVFFCKGVNCGMIAIETPYIKQEDCKQEVTQVEDTMRKDKTLTVVEGRCAKFYLKNTNYAIYEPIFY